MIDIFSYDFIAQAVGIIASGFIIFSFNQKIDNHLKIYLMIGNLLFASHFFMLGAYAGMAINLLNFVRVGASIKFHKSTRMMMVFMTLYVVVGILVYQKPTDLLPVFSSFLGTYSMFKLSGVKLRLVGLLGSSAWLTYGVIYKSIGGILTDSISIILSLTTIYRLMRDKKKSETHDQNA